MLVWAKNAHLGTQQPVKRQPNFTTCNACLTSHQSNCFLPQASKLLGVDFMASDLYNPQYPMVKSPFLKNCFGQKLNGDFLMKANGFHLNLKKITTTAVSEDRLKQLKSKSKPTIDLTVKAPSKKKSKTVESEDVIVVNPRNPLATTPSSGHSQSPFNTNLAFWFVRQR